MFYVFLSFWGSTVEKSPPEENNPPDAFPNKLPPPVPEPNNPDGFSSFFFYGCPPAINSLFLESSSFLVFVGMPKPANPENRPFDVGFAEEGPNWGVDCPADKEELEMEEVAILLKRELVWLLGDKVGGEEENRGGWDLVFPKSPPWFWLGFAIVNSQIIKLKLLIQSNTWSSLRFGCPVLIVFELLRVSSHYSLDVEISFKEVHQECSLSFLSLHGIKVKIVYVQPFQPQQTTQLPTILLQSLFLASLPRNIETFFLLFFPPLLWGKRTTFYFHQIQKTIFLCIIKVQERASHVTDKKTKVVEEKG